MIHASSQQSDLQLLSIFRDAAMPVSPPSHPRIHLLRDSSQQPIHSRDPSCNQATRVHVFTAIIASSVIPPIDHRRPSCLPLPIPRIIASSPAHEISRRSHAQQPVIQLLPTASLFRIPSIQASRSRSTSSFQPSASNLAAQSTGSASSLPESTSQPSHDPASVPKKRSRARSQAPVPPHLHTQSRLGRPIRRGSRL